jgi:hypothetical protein
LGTVGRSFRRIVDVLTHRTSDAVNQRAKAPNDDRQRARVLRLPQALQVTHRLARATRRSCERPKPKEAQADCNQSLDDVVDSEDVVIGDALDDVAKPA